VIAAASSADKLELARSRGASETIDYTKEDLKARLKELTRGKGVDVAYDPVGGTRTEEALRAMAWGGRLLIVGFAAGEVPKLPANLPLLKSCAIVGVFWGSFLQREPAGARAEHEEILRLVASGELRPHVEKTLPLARAGEAIRELADRRAVGRIVLVTR
jgi:NADPH2:quinone reductase